MEIKRYPFPESPIVTMGVGGIARSGIAYLQTPPMPCSASYNTGDTATINVTVSGGTPNYTYRLYVDGVLKDTFGPTNSTSHVFNYTFTSAGSYTVKVEVTDSCPSGAKVADKTCSVTVSTPCTTPTVDFTMS